MIKKSLHRISVDPVFRLFSSEMVQDAVTKAGGSKARGIDGISYPQLKHLGPRALVALTALFNWSVEDNSIPKRWKVASIIPLLKPGQGSYNPLFLPTHISTLQYVQDNRALNPQQGLPLHLPIPRPTRFPVRSTPLPPCSAHYRKQ